jgi:histidinol-phosphatase (PHP family)
MLMDYHIHTRLCGHAHGEMDEYIQRARKVGLQEMGFADHIPMYFMPEKERDATIAMLEDELPEYVEAVLTRKKANPDLEIRLGLEADFVPGKEEILAEYLKAYPFDYIIGSIHFLDEWGFDNPHFIDVYQRWDIDELYHKYFQLVQQAAATRLFDILGHLDLIKKFGFRPTKDISNLYEETIRVIKDADVAIEINTAGLRVPVKEMYPTIDILKLCKKHDVPITLGSDSHKPEQVGMNFPEALKMLREIGINQLAIFEQRQRKMVDI